MLDSLSPTAWHIARQLRPSSATGRPLGVPTAPHSHLMWLVSMDPGRYDYSSLGQGLRADPPTCPPLRALYEGDPQWRMLEPESQDPAQGAAGYRVQPPLGLPPLLPHSKYPQSPTRPPSCHAEYLEPGGLHSSTSVLSPGDSFRWPRPCEYAVTCYREAV